MANADESSWRTPNFRQSVVAKIEEAIRSSGMPTTKNSMEMENHVFQKAKTKEEYLGFVARLILHVREMNSKKNAGMGGPQGPGGQNMQDPINALQTLARQGSGNQMMGMVPPQGPQVTATNCDFQLEEERNLKNQLLRIQIYKTKLEALKLERELGLPPSEFTKGIEDSSNLDSFVFVKQEPDF